MPDQRAHPRRNAFAERRDQRRLSGSSLAGDEYEPSTPGLRFAQTRAKRLKLGFALDEIHGRILLRRPENRQRAKCNPLR
jgi:hypothetical protein